MMAGLFYGGRRGPRVAFCADHTAFTSEQCTLLVGPHSDFCSDWRRLICPSSRFTAGVSEFFILRQSGERASRRPIRNGRGSPEIDAQPVRADPVGHYRAMVERAFL
jgi:hypothetical protein